MLATVSRYIVKAGDTLPSIAKEVYGDPATWSRIAQFNQLDYPYIAVEDTSARARGYVTVYRDPTYLTENPLDDIVIPSNTMFTASSDGGTKTYELQTKASVTFVSWLPLIELPIVCTSYGIFGETPASTIVALSTPISKVSSIINSEPVTLYPTYIRAVGEIDVSIIGTPPTTFNQGMILSTTYSQNTQTDIRYYQVTEDVVGGTTNTLPVRAMESGNVGNVPPDSINTINFYTPQIKVASIDATHKKVYLTSNKHGITAGSSFRLAETLGNDGVYLCASVSLDGSTITLNSAGGDLITPESDNGTIQKMPSFMEYVASVSNADAISNGVILKVAALGNILYIPAMSATTNTPPSELEADVYIRRLKQDIFLDPDGDIAIDVTGDIRVVEGLSNIEQALRIRLSSNVGSLTHHPEYGSLVHRFIGSLGNAINLMIIKKEIIRTLRAEERVARIDDVRLTFANRTLDIRIYATIIGSDDIQNIAFSINP